MVKYRYSPERLAEVAAEARNVADLMRRLGMRCTGGGHAHISRQLKRFGIDTSHFTGSAHNRGQRGYYRLTAEALLTKRPEGSRRTPGFRLRRAMLEIGLPEQCEVCGVVAVWRGHPLTLHVDHINGDFLDSRPHNVRFLCPNCHSQTSTYAGARRGGDAPVLVVYDASATTPTGIPLGRRLPRQPQWAMRVFLVHAEGS